MHLGRNIAKYRDLKGIKQEQLARMIGISQQAISKLETKENIDDSQLDKIAEALETTSEALKNYNPTATIQSINQQGGNVININPIDKIIELYERLLNEKDSVINLYKNSR